MRFSSDEIKPLYEVRQNLSKVVDTVERVGAEIVIARHGKPVAAVISAAGLYRYRSLELLVRQLIGESREAGTIVKESAFASTVNDLALELTRKHGSISGDSDG